jgi:hypothetical protein
VSPAALSAMTTPSTTSSTSIPTPTTSPSTTSTTATSVTATSRTVPKPRASRNQSTPRTQPSLPRAQSTSTTAQSTPQTSIADPNAELFAQLRMCESHNNYTENTGNGYYGAYQFSVATWRTMGYSGLPSEGSPEQQDEAARRLQARSGWRQWPACARKLGLR